MKKAKSIDAIHIYGCPADMDKIKSICTEKLNFDRRYLRKYGC